MENTKICVYTICKNELQFVDKWLDSMTGADYIVVLDTGSTDGTFEKLQNDSRVTRVEQKEIKPWRFDVARNESMKLVPEDAEVLVCTDFDELFNPGWADVIRKYWDPSKYNRMHYTYAWSHTPTGVPTDIFTYDKIHTKDYYWKYPVHEVLWRDDFTKEVAINVGERIYLHHWQDKSKSRKSYFDLLNLSVQENPEDSHVRMLLAREYLLNHDYDKALENYLAVLQMPDIDDPSKKLVLLEALGRCGDIYMVKENMDEAIWYAQEFIKEDSTYREPYLIMAKAYNQMKMYTLAESMVDAALKYGQKKNTWVERADSWTYLPDEQYGIAYYYRGEYDKAVEHGNKALRFYPNDITLLQNANGYMEALIAFNMEKLNTK